MTGFQKVINQQLAPAVEGDFASANPRATIPPSIAGAWKVAAGQTVRVGYFAWGAADGLVYSSLAAAVAIGGATLGFVGRTPNIPSVLITTFLAESAMVLNAGMPCTLHRMGDFWINLAAVDPGDAIFALEATGAPSLIDDATTAPTGAVGASTSLVNAVTAATTTIAVNTGVMTIATVSSGVVAAGQRVSGTGVPAGTYITAQLTGVAGGAGTYQTNSLNRAAVAAFAATMSQGTLAKITL